MGIPFSHYVRIAHQALDDEHATTYTADVSERFKQLCAGAHLPYDGQIAGKAIEAAEHTRARKAVSA